TRLLVLARNDQIALPILTCPRRSKRQRDSSTQSRSLSLHSSDSEIARGIRCVDRTTVMPMWQSSGGYQSERTWRFSFVPRSSISPIHLHWGLPMLSWAHQVLGRSLQREIQECYSLA